MQVPAVRVATSEDLLHPGEYIFIHARKPEIRIERTPLTPPEGFVKRLFWNRFGKKYNEKYIETEVWPKIDTIVIQCPKCNGTLATTKQHTILSVEPLKLDTPMTCIYCRNFTFEVKDGKFTELNATAVA